MCKHFFFQRFLEHWPVEIDRKHRHRISMTTYWNKIVISCADCKCPFGNLQDTKFWTSTCRTDCLPTCEFRSENNENNCDTCGDGETGRNMPFFFYDYHDKVLKLSLHEKEEISLETFLIRESLKVIKLCASKGGEGSEKKAIAFYKKLRYATEDDLIETSDGESDSESDSESDNDSESDSESDDDDVIVVEGPIFKKRRTKLFV